MSTQQVFWFFVITSVSSVSEAAKNETNLNLKGGMKLSFNITTIEAKVASSDIKREARNVVSVLPKQTTNGNVYFYEERSRERNDVSVSDHKVKENSSDSVKSTYRYETPLRYNVSESSIEEHVSLKYSTNPDDGPYYYNEDEYVKENESEEGNTKKDATDEEKDRGNKEFLLMNGLPSTRQSYLVTYMTDSGAQSVLLDDDIHYHNDITESSTYTTMNNSMKAPNDTGNEMQSEPDHATQYTASEYTDNTSSDSSGTGYAGSTDTVTDRIVKLISVEVQGGIHRTATSEEPAERYRTMKHTPKRGGEPSRSPYPVENDYDDDYYEAWRENRGRSTTMSAIQSMAADDKTHRDYAAYFPGRTFDTETIKNLYTTDEFTNATVDYSTVSEEGVRATIGTKKPSMSIKALPYFPTGQDVGHSFGSETVKNFYPSEEVTNAAFDYDSTPSEEGVRATTNTRKLLLSMEVVPHFPIGQNAEHTFDTETVTNVYTLDEFITASDHDSKEREEGASETIAPRTTVSMQDNATSEDIPKTEKVEFFQVLENVDVANNTAFRQLEKNYNSVETTNNASTTVSVSGKSVSRYGSSRRTPHTKRNEFNCSSNESQCSTTPQDSAAFKVFEEATKSVRYFQNGNEFDLRAQRESFREGFKVSDDFAACEDCDAEDDSEEAGVLELPTKEKVAPDNSDIPENYDTCLENDTDATVRKNETKIRPGTQKPTGEVWDKQGAKNKSRKGDKIGTKLMVDEPTHRKMPGFTWKVLPTGSYRAGIRETSFSEYPWFVLIETSKTGMRCAGAMVAPRWLITASSCMRSDDTRTDAYSVHVEVKVNVTGKSYQAVRAVFSEGGGVALVRLREPPESALFMTGRLDVADAAPPTLWTFCVVLGMGRCEEEGHKRDRTLRYPELVFAVGAWAFAMEESRSQVDGSERAAPGVVRAPCGGDPGAPLACHRDYVDRSGHPPSSALPLQPAENELAGLVLVGVSAGHNRPGLGCRGSTTDYWSVATLQPWLEDAIASTNAELDRISGRRMTLPPDPYTQRVRRLREEGSLPEPRYSRGTSHSCRRIVTPLTAAAVAAATSWILFAS